VFSEVEQPWRIDAGASWHPYALPKMRRACAGR
jgi:hypothetical protein